MTPTIPESLARLSRAWPTAPVTAEAKQGYAEACIDHDPRDVADAVHRLVRGQVQRAYPELMPPPAALALEIRKSRDARLDDEARNRPRLAPPPPPSREEMESRKAMVARLRAEGGGMLLKRMPAGFHITPAEHEAAKARAAKEAMEAHRADVILRAAAGDESALAEWRAQNEAEGIAARSGNERAA